jgi:hypothetical protein
LDFTSADADEAPGLEAKAAPVNEAAARAADTLMASERLMPYLLKQSSHRPSSVIRSVPGHRNTFFNYASVSQKACLELIRGLPAAATGPVSHTAHEYGNVIGYERLRPTATGR